jgi:hypothetical protein
MAETPRSNESEPPAETHPELILPNDVKEQLQKERGEKSEGKPVAKIIIEEQIGRPRTKDEQTEFQEKREEAEKIIKNKRYVEQREREAKEAKDRGDLPDVVYDKERADKLFEERAKKRGEGLKENLTPPPPEKVDSEKMKKEVQETRDRLAEQERQQKKEKALEVLSDPKIMERSPRELVESFRNLTENENGEHRHLSKERNEMAYGNLQERGMRIIRGKDAIEEARQRIATREQDKIKSEEHSRAIKTFWERNSDIKPEDREKYLGDIKKRLGLDGVDGDFAFEKLVNDSYLVEKAKTGWFSDKIKIPKINGKSLSYDKELLQEMAQEEKNRISVEAQKRADLKIIEGRKRVLKEKQVCARKIIEKTVAEYSSKETAGENEASEDKKSEAKVPTVEKKTLGKEAKEGAREALTGDVKRDTKTIKDYLAEYGQKVNVRDIERAYNRSLKKYKEHGVIGAAFEVLATLQREVKKAKERKPALKKPPKKTSQNRG